MTFWDYQSEKDCVTSTVQTLDWNAKTKQQQNQKISSYVTRAGFGLIVIKKCLKHVLENLTWLIRWKRRSWFNPKSYGLDFNLGRGICPHDKMQETQIHFTGSHDDHIDDIIVLTSLNIFTTSWRHHVACRLFLTWIIPLIDI